MHSLSRSLAIVAFLAAPLAPCAACGGPPAPSATAGTQAGAGRGAEAAHEAPQDAGDAGVGGRAVFDGLLAEVLRLHVFTPQTEKNLGRRAEDDLASLAAEFERADTRAKLSVAVEHFVNGLHNPHCWFDPSSRGDALTLGFSVNAEWKGTTPIFRVWHVDDVALRAVIAEGDTVRSVDGVAAAALVDAHALVSDANNRRGVADAVARWLTFRKTSRAIVSQGQTSEWVLTGRDGAPKTVRPLWKQASEAWWSEFSLDLAKDGCAGLKHRKYGSYELAFVGSRYCIYASKLAPFRDYPIVRHFSFLYIDEDWGRSPTWLAQADQRNLKQQLASLSPKGVILDLRDNGGGNNPNWLLDWWAPAGWTDTRVQIRLVEALRDQATRQRLGVSIGDGKGTWYSAQLDRRTKGQELSAPRPFFCKPGPAADPAEKDCTWDNRYSPAHRVTPAPVALLVGPDCVSSCDSFALSFDQNDFGPLVGEPTAAGYTTTRMTLKVNDGTGFDMGSIRIALSKEISGLTGRDIEAVPLRVDYPIDRSFDGRDTHDAALVAGALRGFREYKFPR